MTKSMVIKCAIIKKRPPLMDEEKITISLKQLKKKKIPRKKIIISALSVFLIGGVIASLFVFIPKKPNTAVANQNGELGFQTTPTVTPSPTPVPLIYRNPFTGQKTTLETLTGYANRPLAIMMDNSSQARFVQENLNKSDMVYEALVEGGWTRFMPMYYSEQADMKVMPVRSVRMVFLDNLTEYNDMLLYHVGGAETPGVPKTNALQRIVDEKIKSVFYYEGNLWKSFNELYDAKCFAKGGIPGYSCKYQMTASIWKKATEAGMQATRWEPDNDFEWMWKFSETDSTQSDIPANNISYNFASNKNYNAEWKFDAGSSTYLRSINGTKLIDHADEKQVWASTVIVQKVKYKLDVDDKLRSIAYTDGSGEGHIFMNGKAYDVTWKKDCDTANKCRTRYYNKLDAKEFVFLPGKIWVSVAQEKEIPVYTP
jgi:Protein of unknown function (DUF3048) N-terminal domain/Protein of unknown function (DUF3048) C-terminal domain